MSAATAMVPAICWREPLRTMSAAPFTASSAARAMAAADACDRIGRRPQRIFGAGTRLARCAPEGDGKEDNGQQCRSPAKNAERREGAKLELEPKIKCDEAKGERQNRRLTRRAWRARW